MGSHVTPQASAGSERCVARQALVRLQARVCPDMSFEDSRRRKTSTALYTLVGPFSRVRPEDEAIKREWFEEEL